MPFQVLLVDDHKIMRDGIKAILRHSDEFAVLGEAESGTEAVQICKKKRPDIILMDIGLPGLNGIETTTEILRHYPDVKIIILSMYDDEHSVVSAIRSGARAFVLKKASDDDLLDALRAVAKGGSYLSPQVSDRLLQSHSTGRPGIEARLLRARRSLSARIASAAPGGRRQNQQGDRGDAGSRPANRPQLSQDDDEEAGREQRRRTHAGGARGRHHALSRFRAPARANRADMIDTPWGLLPVADAHVHFFSHRFFASLAEQKGVAVDRAGAAPELAIAAPKIPGSLPTPGSRSWIGTASRKLR